MKKFMVWSTCMECVAHLDCLAESREDAEKQFEDTFRTDHPEVVDGAFWARTVVDCSASPHMEKHWKHHGYSYWSGMYQYGEA